MRGCLFPMRAFSERIRRWLMAAERDWLGEDCSVDRRIQRLEVDSPSAWCARCGASVARGERREPCLECEDARSRHGRVVRLAELRDGWRHALMQVKYARDAVGAELLGRRLAEQHLACGGEPAGADVVVVPVPAASIRRWHRGIDPVGEIAASFARTLTIPVVRPLWHAGGVPRTGQSREARRRRRLARRAGWSDEALTGLRIVLIDDVLTTGATVREAARLLRGMGTAEIDVAVVAVTPPLGRRSSPKMSV
jgi:predicted amidophosphoribosyltransferase